MNVTRYNKTTRDRLIQLLESIGYKVTNQSSDGSYKLVRLPDSNDSTEYWIFEDRIEHRLKNYRGGSTFYFNDCFFELDKESPTVSVVAKNNKGCFISLHNFDTKLNDTRTS